MRQKELFEKARRRFPRKYRVYRQACVALRQFKLDNDWEVITPENIEPNMRLRLSGMRAKYRSALKEWQSCLARVAK